MISGINMLMALVIQLGGIDLLASGLARLMSPVTAPGVMGLTAGIMSWFSSTSGVVMPTLIPTVTDVAAQVGGGRLDACAALRHHQHGQRGRNEPHFHRRLHGSCGPTPRLPIPPRRSAPSCSFSCSRCPSGGVIVIALFGMTGVYGLFM